MTNEITSAEVAIELLTPNPWNTNQMTPEHEAKLEASIRRLGLFKPIVVRTLADDTLQIVGGQHRWEAARRMGYEQVPIVNLGVISDKKAKEIGLVDNGRYGADDTAGLADLLKSLGSMEELSEFLPDDISINAMLDSLPVLTAKDLEINENADLPAPPPAAPTSQSMRFNVPVEDVAWITGLIEDTMRDQNLTAEDSRTNAGNAVVYLFKQMRKV